MKQGNERSAAYYAFAYLTIGAAIGGVATMSGLLWLQIVTGP